MNNLIIYDFLHKILTTCYIVLIKVLRVKSKFIGCKFLKDNFKSSDTLFILAPGSSINDYSNEDFKNISKYNSLGINNFIIHDFVPTFYLLEAQPLELNYFNILTDKEKKLLDTPFLYKGYASLSINKFKNTIMNIINIPKNLNAFFIMKDAYVKGDWDSIPNYFKNKILDCNKSDFLYNYISSLNYATILGYKMGYKSIVLCGFDMDDRYFYCENKAMLELINKYKLCKKSAVNIINNDNERVKPIINLLSNMDSKFKHERNGGIYVFSSNMSLSKYLPVYSN